MRYCAAWIERQGWRSCVSGRDKVMGSQGR